MLFLSRWLSLGNRCVYGRILVMHLSECINLQLFYFAAKYGKKGYKQVGFGWLVGCFGLHGPLRQYFSLYRAFSQREGERKEK